MQTLDEIQKLRKLDLESCIIEEASELIQAFCKLHRFGERPFFEGVQYDNLKDIKTEWLQIAELMSEWLRRQ